jgi:PPOX class probable F420-dependent enzyme
MGEGVRIMPTVPASHADLLANMVDVVLTTEMPDGRLQSTVVWFSANRGDILVNTMREFQKARNLLARPRATVLIREPPPGERWIEIRAGVTIEEAGAMAHLDMLARAYEHADRYFGEVVPAELAAVEHPLLCRLRPLHITVGPTRDPPRSPGVEPAASVGTGPRGCSRDVAIPASHRDLLERPLLAALSTHLRSGAQTHPVWFGWDGNDLLISTTLERTKGRNLQRDPRATILVIDPEDGGRWIEIRGDVELQHAEDEDLLDRLTQRYTGWPSFYGCIYPENRRGAETRVTVRIHPVHVNRDAIH